MSKFFIMVVIPLIIIPLFVSCTSSSNKPDLIKIRDQESVKNNDIFALAPGQVALQATVIDINKLESKIVFSILIKKVLEYGAATPPIANGSNLVVYVKDGALNKQVHNNDLITVVMRNKPIGPGSKNNTSWEILRFK